MPSLEFKGKQFIYTHHLSVPFRELVPDEKKSVAARGGKASMDGNLIIHGDNLEALKALLPIYAGQVDCIFIDPPYNTGNEGWCYNDKVNSPLMREWQKKSANPVDKEDLERHDKWLCMMWPRLKLLYELLAPGGIIYVCIDDVEMHRLRCLFDDIFGEDSFIAAFPRRTKAGGGSAAAHFAVEHDYVFAFAKSKNLVEAMHIDYDEDYAKRYREEDDLGKFYWDTFERSYTATKPYKIEAPDGTWLEGNWFRSEKRFLVDKEKGEIRITPKSGGGWSVQFKQRMPKGRKLRSLLHGNEFKSDPTELADLGIEFDYPKPVFLVQHLLEAATDKDSLILDSFAGSGTTAHAVLAMNAKDDGNRRFILVECEDYADKLTAERVRRVIQGYAFTGTQRKELMKEKLTLTNLKKAGELIEKADSIEALEGNRYDKVKREVKDGVFLVTGEKAVKEKTAGLGGSFTYCTLGKEMNLESIVRGEGELPDYESLARYVFFTATGQALAKLPPRSPDGFIGETPLYSLHLHYQPDRAWLRSGEAQLHENQVRDITARKPPGKKALVFAVGKYMSQKALTPLGVEFCQLPYAIHRMVGG